MSSCQRSQMSSRHIIITRPDTGVPSIAKLVKLHLLDVVLNITMLTKQEWVSLKAMPLSLSLTALSTTTMLLIVLEYC